VPAWACHFLAPNEVITRVAGETGGCRTMAMTGSNTWPDPQIDADAWVAESAVVIGNVRMAAGSSLWPTAVARGDLEQISIGAGSNVQDGAVLHGDPGQPVHIGADVTVGHRAVIHGATLEDGCLVGIGAIVLNGVTVGADEEVMTEGDFFEDTQSALVLEELISKFLFNEVGG